MKFRFNILALLTVVIIAMPMTVDAGIPAGLAFKLQTEREDRDPFDTTRQSLEWYQYFGEHLFASGSNATFDFTIIPFDTGSTIIGADEIGGETILSVHFQDGLVGDSLPYKEKDWNCVGVVIDGVQRTYILWVNGRSAGPYQLHNIDPNVAISIQALRVHSFNSRRQTIAWLDEIQLVMKSTTDSATLYSATFDDGTSYDSAGRGTKIIATPPVGTTVPSECEVSTSSLDISGRQNTYGDIAVGAASPSPSTGSITLPYQILTDATVHITIYNQLGIPVYEVASKRQVAGNYQMQWNAVDRSGALTPAGNYFIRLSTSNSTVFRKISIIR